MQRRTFIKSATASVLALAAPESLISRIEAAGVDARRRSGALGRLRSRFRGTLLFPRQPGYLAWAHSVNSMYNGVLPLAIAFCETAEDVSACVTWARSARVPVGTKGGGHNYHGASTSRGLLIVTRPMNSMRLDPESRTLVVGSGVLNGAVHQLLKGGDLILPVGACPTVGACGLTLGGGIGKNARWAGLTCDRLRSTEMVLASGRIVTASERSNPDLFWACRGAGGGNFGIHTELTFELVELISPVVSVMQLHYMGADAAVDVFQHVAAIIQSAPNTLTSQIAMRTDPSWLDLPDVPAGDRLDANVFPITSVEFSYQGALDELLELIRPLLDAVTPATRDQTELPFWQATSEWLLEEPSDHVRGFSTVSRFMDRPFSSSAVSDLVDSIVDAPFAQRSMNAGLAAMSWTGGVVNDVAPDATAFVHRNSTAVLNLTSFWLKGTTPKQQLHLLQWLKATYPLIKRESQKEAYQNFPGPLTSDWRTAYYGANLQRLIEVKRRYDPYNMFRHAQSVPLA